MFQLQEAVQLLVYQEDRDFLLLGEGAFGFDRNNKAIQFRTEDRFGLTPFPTLIELGVTIPTSREDDAMWKEIDGFADDLNSSGTRHRTSKLPPWAEKWFEKNISEKVCPCLAQTLTLIPTLALTLT